MAACVRNQKPIRIILLGDSNVGKTSLLQSFIYRKCGDTKPTISHLIETVSCNVGDVSLFELHIFDTGGQERFNSITRSYYRDTDGVILVYDVTCMKSFSALTGWLNDINENCGNDIKVVIVGNKIDQPKKEVVEKIAKDFAAEKGYKYVKTSAVENENVEEIFRTLIREILPSIKEDEINEVTFGPVQVGDTSTPPSSLQWGKTSGRISKETIANISSQLGISEKDKDKVVLHQTQTLFGWFWGVVSNGFRRISCC